MKIKTTNDLQDAIDHEMSWRKRELSAIRANVVNSKRHAKETAIRAAVALLYAHWEGSIKNIATYYLEYVAMQSVSYGQLKPNFLAIAIRYDLKQFKNSNKSTVHTSIVSDIIKFQTVKSKIPTEGIIKTDSNLNSEIFIEIMSTIGLPCDDYEASYKLIDSVLLEKRNKIAHGERIESLELDEDRYCELHDQIFKLIQTFATQVSNAASLKYYLKT